VHNLLPQHRPSNITTVSARLSLRLASGGEHKGILAQSRLALLVRSLDSESHGPPYFVRATSRVRTSVFPCSPQQAMLSSDSPLRVTITFFISYFTRRNTGPRQPISGIAPVPCGRTQCSTPDRLLAPSLGQTLDRCNDA
jgi:hypothetical protein